MFTWAPRTLTNTWLRVDILTTAEQGFVDQNIKDRIFFGHSDATNFSEIFNNASNNASINNKFDINKDGKVSFSDAWAAYQTSLNPPAPLNLITVN